MKKIRISVTSYRIFKSILAMVLIVVLLFGSNSNVVKADDATESYNLHTISNTLANIFSVGNMPKPWNKDTDGGTEEDHSAYGGVAGVQPLAGSIAGSGGIVVGILTEMTSLGDWLSAAISGSSTSYEYTTLQNIYTDNSDNGWGISNSAYYYALYGKTLNDLGLDSVGFNVNGDFNIGRFLTGILMLGAYLFANGAYGLFSGIIDILQVLNPFWWLSGVAQNADGYFENVAATGETGAGAEIMRTFSQVYAAFANLSWGFTIPLMLALYFFGLFVMKKTRSTKRLLIRVVFLAIGVPLTGSLYTSFLNNMQDMFTSQLSSADEIVLSTFVDFEGWVKKSNLKLPNGEKIIINVSANNQNGSVTTASTAAVRDLCYKINKSVYALNTSNLNSSEKNSSLSSNLVLEDIEFDSDGDMTNNTTKIDADVVDLLWRYAKSSKLTASEYASYIQKQISDTEYDNIETENYAILLKCAANLGGYSIMQPKVWSIDNLLGNLEAWWQSVKSAVTQDGEKGEYAFHRSDDDKPQGSKENKVVTEHFSTLGDVKNTVSYSQKLGHRLYRWDSYPTIFNNGGLQSYLTTNGKDTYDNTDGAIGWNGLSENSTITFTQWSGDSYKEDAGTKLQLTRGLSDMSMFNYLSSDFGDRNVTVYSGTGVASGLTQPNHYAVNLVGNEFLSWFYYTDTLSMLLCVAIIGVVYAVSMLSHSIKNSLNVLKTMPLAMMGSIQYMAKFFGIVISMISSVLVTAIFYGMSSTFLIGISQFVENVLSNSLFGVLYAGTAGASLIGGIGTFMGYHMILYVVNIIITIMITRFLLKIRKQTVSQITEWLQQVVGKFMEADAHPNPDKPKGNLGASIVNGAMRMEHIHTAIWMI